MSITGTPLNTSNVYQFSLVKNQNVTFTGNNNDGLFLWGAQVEQKSTSSSYIPTQNSAVTRFSDVCSVTTPAGVTTITETFANNTSNVITSIPTTYTVNTGLIKKIIMN